MTYYEPARATGRGVRGIHVAGLMVVIAAIAFALGDQLLASSSTPDAAPAAVPRAERSGQHPRAFGEAGGAVPAGTTVFDDGVPGVAKLEPALRDALRRAATDAARDGVELHVDSGWRSRAYQARLLREAVSKYGSESEAARWVATPDTSAHVSGEAVDIGPADAAAWLSAHGASYGLCQVYGNEPWHYERRSDAADAGCPAVYADPTQDPRMQR